MARNKVIDVPVTALDEDAKVLLNSAQAVLPEEPVARSALDMDPADFAAALERVDTNRGLLMAWIRAHLVDGTPACYPAPCEKRGWKTQRGWQDNDRFDPALHNSRPGDYGRIWSNQGWSKPSLWKSGAEKVLGMLRLTPRWPDLDAYVQAALVGQLQQVIVLRCEVLDSRGRVIGQGIGSAVNDSDDVNKALKMAKKSSLIDATLSCAGISELFTQDIEDMTFEAPAQPTPDPVRTPKPSSKGVSFGPRPPPPVAATPPPEPGVGEGPPVDSPRAAPDRGAVIEGLVTDLGWTHAQARLWMVALFPELKQVKGGGFPWKDLSDAQANTVVDAMQAILDRRKEEIGR